MLSVREFVQANSLVFYLKYQIKEAFMKKITFIFLLLTCYNFLHGQQEENICSHEPNQLYYAFLSVETDNRSQCKLVDASNNLASRKLFKNQECTFRYDSYNVYIAIDETLKHMQYAYFVGPVQLLIQNDIINKKSLFEKKLDKITDRIDLLILKKANCEYQLDNDKIAMLACNIAKSIKEEMSLARQIKVSNIRKKRAVKDSR
jgi:hypothetical protein